MKRKCILVGLLALAMLTACSFTEGSSSTPQNSEASSQSQAAESSVQSTDSSLQNSSVEESFEESSDETSVEEESSAEESAEEESASEEEKQVYYTVSFYSDGGSDVPAVTVLAGEKIPQPAEPSKASKDYEYTFLGWYYNGEAWDFEKDVVSEDITLVAKWEEKEHYTNPFLPKN